jgi:hypothetical protein
LICHELTHPLCWRKYNHRHISHNNKKWKYQLGRIIAYCKKKNFWQEEIQKWRTPKAIEPEPTKQEIQQQKIIKAETKIKKYETKIKMYQRKLSRTRRSLSMLKKG